MTNENDKKKSLDIKKLIQSCGLKATHQRIVVYQAICDLGHASADMVIDHVLKVFPTLTVATVYNILESFVSVNLIRRLPSSGNKMFFDATIENHLHIYSEDTQSYQDYNDDELKNIISEHLKKRGIEENISGFDLILKRKLNSI